MASSVVGKRLACLEQLVGEVVNLAGHDAVRALVCDEPAVDRAITACFGCTRGSLGLADVVEGLTSYINHLDKNAPGVLMLGFGGLAA